MTKPHHTQAGFRNNYPHDPPGSFWKWQWERARERLPNKPEGGYKFQLVKNTLLPEEPSITWIGHATLLLKVGGLSILTDPHFSERASPVRFAGPRRVVPPALELHRLPHIDIVLISHNHYDHLDLASVAALNKQPNGPPRFYVGLGLKAWFADKGIANVEEMDWWEHREHRDLNVHFVPVQHWSARTPWNRNKTLWGGFFLEHASLRFLFTGDTGYSQDFKDIRRRLGEVDLAALPIGGYEPRWFMRIMHINPEEAAQIHKDLGAKQSLAMHWGTFDDLTDESLYEPPQKLVDALAKKGVAREQFWIFKHGETRSLSELRERPDVRQAQAAFVRR